MTGESSKYKPGRKMDNYLKLTQVHLKPLYQGINLQQVQDQCSVDMTAGVDAQL